MKVHDFLAELGQKMGLPQLGLDEDNCCRLVFDETIPVDFEYVESDKVLHLSSAVAPLPIQNKERFYEKLLRANLFGVETGGASFALNAVDSDIILFRSCDIENLDFTDACLILENFIQAAEAWKEKLHDESLIREPSDDKPFIPDQYTIRG